MDTQNIKLNELIEGLNPEQKTAACHVSGPELVIAGAGSGKTRVLTARIAMLMSMGVIPERILALTFTKKAAEEMRSRIVDIAGNDAKRLRMGTFHSVFITFLRPYAHLLGFPENFTILDEDDSLSCFKRCTKNILSQSRPPEDSWSEKQIKMYKAEDANYKPKACKSRISYCKNELVTAAEYNQDTQYYIQDQHAKRPLLGKIFTEYQNTCFRNGVMDFDDIILYTDMLMSNYPEVSAQIAACFDYILVDEYQDTNVAQNSILHRLTRRNRNICVVGDDSQSIYAFRGAKVQNIFNFRHEFKECQMVRLERNYRSTQNIVNAANRLIAFNEDRIPKTCFSSAEEGDAIEKVIVNSERHEGDYIAMEIAARIKENPDLTYNDFAVLYRTNSQSRAIEDSLIRRRIPYVIYSGTSFFERTEVKDQMAYFKLAVNPLDDESFRRVVNKPVRGVGSTAMKKLDEFARENNMTLWDAINDIRLESIGLSKKPLLGLTEFREIIEQAIELAKEKNAFEAAYGISNLSGIYQDYMDEDTEESRNRADNVRELVSSVKAFQMDIRSNNEDLKEEFRIPDNLASYIQHITLLSDADTTDDQKEKVSLMTVHCAKGLEFTNVFVAGMEKDLFPIEMEGTRKEIEEERRLFYVAVTRAKKKLILTSANTRLRFGQRKHMSPSPFLNELLPEKKPEKKKKI